MLNRNQGSIQVAARDVTFGVNVFVFALITMTLCLSIVGCSSASPTQPQDVIVPEVMEKFDRPDAILFIGGPGLADHRDIFIINPDGSDKECITCDTSLVVPESPAWSPDGMAFAFSKTSQSNTSVMGGINVSWVGGVNYSLVFGPDNFADPTWSPDGDQIAFTYSMALEDSPALGSQFADAQICVLPMPSSGGPDAIVQIRCLTTDGWNRQPHWSPDGKKILYSGSTDRDSTSDLFIIDIDDLSIIPLTQTPTLSELAPKWSPDGKKIAYYIYDPATKERNIWLMNSDGSKPVNLMTGPEDGWDPSWSPDGSQIAFVTSRTSKADQPWCEAGCLGYSELYVMDADGAGPVNITNDPEVSIETPTWRPRILNQVSWTWWVAGVSGALLIVIVSILLLRRRRKARSVV